jgi:DNA helicase HerA-like ATPase
MANSGDFYGAETWEDFLQVVKSYTQSDKKNTTKEISVMSWRKFYRLFNKSYQKCKQMFTNKLGDDGVRLRDEIANINKNDVMVIDVAKLDEESQGFVFGDVMRAVYNLKLGASKRPDEEIPDRIIIFIDELNKYASSDVPKSSPILHQLLDITERGRSLGIVLFGAEQFVSDIHRRVKGNCATQAFGRTNAIEITREDFRFVPSVYKTMLTRMRQGEYIIQNPVFRSMLHINFPLPIYKYYNE